MRTLALRRSLLFCLILGFALAGCGDDFSEKARGQILVTLGDGTSVTGSGEISFMPRIPGDPPASEIFLIENSADEGTLTVNSVTLRTNSPYLELFSDNVAATCGIDGCTVSEFELESRVTKQFDVRYQPLESDLQCGTVPDGKPSDWCGEVEIISNDANRGTITIDVRVPQLSGNMQVCLDGDASCTQTRIIFNPAVPADPAQTARFTVSNVGSNVMRLTEVTPALMPANEFTVEGPTTPVSLNPNQIVEYIVTFQAQVDDDMLERAGTILIRSDAGNVVSLSISVGDARAPQIEVMPTELSFIEVNQGQSETKNVTITNTAGAGAGALTVDLNLDPSTTADYSVSDADGNPRAGGQCTGGGAPATCSQQVVVPAGQSHEVQVTYAPQAATGTNATLRIGSNDPDDGMINVELRGTSGIGFLTGMPTMLTWTDPALGTPESQMVTLTNDGTVDVTITDIEKRNIVPVAGEPLFTFDIDPATTPITLMPMETMMFNVTFTRDAMDMIEQQYAGDIALINDGAGGDVTISLSVGFSP